MDTAREDLPRVSVGTVQDWQRLRANYKHAVIGRLEELITANGLTSERDTLNTHLNQFIDQTFRIAQPNLRINGQTYESLDQNEQNTEPFDETLDRRIWSLADTRLQWHKRIAETRRKLPIDIENIIEEVFGEQQMVDLERWMAMIDPTEEERVENTGLPPGGLGGGEAFHKTLALGEELDQTVPNQGERIDRVTSAIAEVKSLTP